MTDTEELIIKGDVFCYKYMCEDFNLFLFSKFIKKSPNSSGYRYTHHIFDCYQFLLNLVLKLRKLQKNENLRKITCYHVLQPRNWHSINLIG